MKSFTDLSGKVALVTGSSRGLGRLYALDLARAGADVIIHDIDEMAAAQFGEALSGSTVADEIRALERRSTFLAADLTVPRQVELLIEHALEQFGLTDANTRDLERELTSLVGLNVKVNWRGKAGTLTIEYRTLDQLDHFIKRIR